MTEEKLQRFYIEIDRTTRARSHFEIAARDIEHMHQYLAAWTRALVPADSVEVLDEIIKITLLDEEEEEDGVPGDESGSDGSPAEEADAGTRDGAAQPSDG